jgi:hypothetical protein
MAEAWQLPTCRERLAALGLEPTGLATLAAAQGVTPIERPEDLLGDFWPEDERVEDFLAAVDAWQLHDS